jgi:hypothetical protein
MTGLLGNKPWDKFGHIKIGLDWESSHLANTGGSRRLSFQFYKRYELQKIQKVTMKILFQY